MINLPVSEAEAFDYLSILDVKVRHGLDALPRHREVHSEIGAQVDDMAAVTDSDIYRELFDANEACFNAIEAAHKDTISASEVQRVNNRRYLAKKALQERFWPDSPLTERKTDL